MAEEHVKAMEVVNRKKEEYAEIRERVRMVAGKQTVVDPTAIAECQLLLLEISYLETRALQISSVDLGFIK